MSAFVLVPGGSHGAWCYRALLRELGALGHKAIAVELPGHGDDATPRASVEFDSYVAAIAAALRAAGDDELVLAGHSVGGMALADATALQPVRELVYLAGYVLDSGECVLDLIPGSRRETYRRQAAASPENAISVSWDAARERFFEDLPEAEARAAFARLTPEPFGPFLTPARTSARDARADRKRYLLSSRDRHLPGELARAMARKLGGTLESIDAGHDAMLSHPRELARLLVS